MGTKRDRLQTERDELNLYRQYVEGFDPLKLIDQNKGGWTPMSFEEFIQSEEPAKYRLADLPPSFLTGTATRPSYSLEELRDRAREMRASSDLPGRTRKYADVLLPCWASVGKSLPVRQLRSIVLGKYWHRFGHVNGPEPLRSCWTRSVTNAGGKISYVG